MRKNFQRVSIFGLGGFSSPCEAFLLPPGSEIIPVKYAYGAARIVSVNPAPLGTGNYLPI